MTLSDDPNTAHRRSVVSGLSLALVCFLSGKLPAQVTTTTVLPSNTISHMIASRGSLVIGTGRGLARSTDHGLHWVDFSGFPQFSSPSIYSLSVKGDTIWASTGFTKDVNGSPIQTGSGYTVSTDNGNTWVARPQTLDDPKDSIVHYGNNVVKFLPIIVPEQNVTFDVALADSATWIASWSSGLRMSPDLGVTWRRIVLPNSDKTFIAPTDSLGSYTIDPRRDNNYLAFSVALQGRDTVWAGSAGGVNRSTDRGSSWHRISTDNQSSSIVGNWIIAIGIHRTSGGARVWTTNWPGDGPNQQYAVSYSDDAGSTWSNYLNGVKAYGFAFRDTIAYVATVDGVYRTDDGGTTWMRSGTIVDPLSGNRLTTTSFYSVAAQGDTLFAASNDGLAYTVDNNQSPFGMTWHVLRSFVPSGARSSVYAYPNPFSPSQESVRIHYTTGTSSSSVTIDLFDFGMNRVRTLLKDVTRSGESDEVWDARTDGGRTVANGVYFFRVVIGDGDPAWGKILVLQ